MIGALAGRWSQGKDNRYLLAGIRSSDTLDMHVTWIGALGDSHSGKMSLGWY